MNVLVTGAAGFIGSRLVARLLAAGDSVVAVDDLSLGRLDNLPTHAALRFVEMDMCRTEFAALVAEVAPSRVYHLAANSDISRGTAEPRTDLERTFLTTFSVLDAMRAAKTPRELVFASTSAIYGEAKGALREDHGPLAPISLYGAAKLASEAYLSAYCHLHGIKAWVFRFPNVVGPNLTHGAIFDFVQRLARDRTHLDVLGNGTQNKPYLDVDDLLDAIGLGVAKNDEQVDTYNVAGDGMTTVREIAEMVRTGLSLPDAKINYGSENRGWPGDVPTFAYDTSKLRALGWVPQRNSHQAVERAIAAEVVRCKPSS